MKMLTIVLLLCTVDWIYLIHLNLMLNSACQVVVLTDWGLIWAVGTWPSWLAGYFSVGMGWLLALSSFNCELMQHQASPGRWKDTDASCWTCQPSDPGARINRNWPNFKYPAMPTKNRVRRLWSKRLNDELKDISKCYLHWSPASKTVLLSSC